MMKAATLRLPHLKKDWEVKLKLLQTEVGSLEQVAEQLRKLYRPIKLRIKNDYFHRLAEKYSLSQQRLLQDFALAKRYALEGCTLTEERVPLLLRGHNQEVELSSREVRSLLAMQFLGLFQSQPQNFPQPGTFELLFDEQPEIQFKMACLLTYLRAAEAEPLRQFLMQRRSLTEKEADQVLAQAEQSDACLKTIEFSSRPIEEHEGVMVDFANKYIGGGALSYGCVQEEIMFATCPELYVSVLFCESMGRREALFFKGFRRYALPRGYAQQVEYGGADLSGRLLSVVAIDALHYGHGQNQFSSEFVRRELVKAYCGFSVAQDEAAPLVTGNWGCGAFRGIIGLKLVIQAIAAALAGRRLVYCDFGKAEARAVGQLIEGRTVRELMRLLAQLEERRPTRESLLEEIRAAL